MEYGTILNVGLTLHFYKVNAFFALPSLPLSNSNVSFPHDVSFSVRLFFFLPQDFISCPNGDEF